MIAELLLHGGRMASALLTASPKTIPTVHAGRRVACSLMSKTEPTASVR
jgi:hypothetical protein